MSPAAIPDEEMLGGGSNAASSAVATAAEAAAATALASALHTSCTIIDMGSFLLNQVRSRPYTADDAALPCIAGEHVRQILPEALVERAAKFPPFDHLRQVKLQCLITHMQCVCASPYPPNCLGCCEWSSSDAYLSTVAIGQ